MSKSSKVEIQKGSIDCGLPTSKMKTHREHLSDRNKEDVIRKSGQTLTLHEPKSGRK